MSYQTILVQVEPDPARFAPVRAARSIAGLFDAALVGVGAAALDEFLEPAVRYMERPVRRALRDEIQANLHRAEAAFLELVGPAPAKATWRSATDTPLDAMTRLAAGADLIVAARPGKADPKACPEIGALTMAAGLPVVLVPPEADALRADSVVVGWKNTRETRRAVSDALPFLKRAKHVLVVGAVESALDVEVAAELEDVALRLQRHGVKAAVEMRTDVGDAAEMLISLAQREGADLIVVGAYGHSRLHEWAFGGVTEALLRYSPAFVLFSR